MIDIILSSGNLRASKQEQKTVLHLPKVNKLSIYLAHQDSQGKPKLTTDKTWTGESKRTENGYRNTGQKLKLKEENS